MLNEFSHSITVQIADEYIRRRSEALVGQPETAFEGPNEMLEGLVEDFSHQFVPDGRYSFASFDELQSDAMSLSLYPENIGSRYLVYGRNPLMPEAYDLNRDFTAFNLAEFLRVNGYNDDSMNQINQVFRRLYHAENIGNDAEYFRIIQEYHLEDPAFYAFIQPRYQTVGEAFYQHLVNRTNAV